MDKGHKGHTGAPLVEISQVTVSLGGVRALDGVSLNVRSGEHLLIEGGNGAGKSTLLRLMAGEVWPDQLRLPPSESSVGIGSAGRVVWHGPEGPSESPLVGRALTALVSAGQQEALMRHEWRISGEDLVLGGLSGTFFHQQEDKTGRERVRAVAALLGAEALLPRLMPGLSQGELRLLLVARALIRRPALLLLDEAGEGLDAAARERLLAALRSAAGQCTLVLTTHRAGALPFAAARRLVMKDGRLGPAIHSIQGLTEEACPSASLPHTGGDAVRRSDSRPDSRPDSREDHRSEGESPALAPFAFGAGVGLELNKVNVYQDREHLLHDIDWRVRPGESWLVSGGNGAGKSTLLRLLAGELFVAWGGRLRYEFPGRILDIDEEAASAEERDAGDPEGAVSPVEPDRPEPDRPAPDRPALEELRRRVHLVSDREEALYTYDVSGFDLVFSGMDNSVGVYRDPSPEEREQVQSLLRLLGVEHLAERPLRSCSTGETRRLLLARALAGRPDLLLLDEPCSGLDAAARASFLELLENLAARGLQMVLVSHHPEDCLPSIRHCLHLEKGRVAALSEREPTRAE